MARHQRRFRLLTGRFGKRDTQPRSEPGIAGHGPNRAVKQDWALALKACRPNRIVRRSSNDPIIDVKSSPLSASHSCIDSLDPKLRGARLSVKDYVPHLQKMLASHAHLWVYYGHHLAILCIFSKSWLTPD
jgi:hypothetical protein